MRPRSYSRGLRNIKNYVNVNVNVNKLDKFIKRYTNYSPLTILAHVLDHCHYACEETATCQLPVVVLPPNSACLFSFYDRERDISTINRYLSSFVCLGSQKYTAK